MAPAGGAPREPYPPDAEDAEAEPAPLRDLVDARVRGADWANERRVGLALDRVEVRDARLTGADLPEAVLTDVVFADCRLDLLGLRGARLERVVFRDCGMGESDLYDASLQDVVFERCVLRRARFACAAVGRVELRGCDLAGASGAEALRGARIPWNDVVANAPVFAAALGIEILD